MTRFQQFMDQRGFTQYRLAKLTGFTKTQISEWQHGKHRPSLASARRLAITLRLPIEDILKQIEIRERVQNTRTREGLFVPRSKKNSQSSRATAETNDSGRMGASYCLTCHRMLDKAA